VAGSGSGAAGGVCVRAKVCGCGAQRVLGERPQRPSRDANTTSRRWRVVTAHGKAVAGSWRGDGGCGAGRAARQGKARAKATGGGTARVRGAGARARARVLVFQSRGVAVPCAGHRHPGPAARHGGEGRRRLRGATAARRVPAQERRQGRKGKGP
jgi:hypothetical protein